MDIYIDGVWCTDDLLHYVVSNSKSLKRLRPTSFHSNKGLTSRGLAKACTKIPLLEDLELNKVDVSVQAIQQIGLSCSQLRYFQFTPSGGAASSPQLAFIIAETMPHLRALRLSSTQLTDKGLKAILNRCVHLENLQLRDSWSYTGIHRDLRKRCLGHIKRLTLPYRKDIRRRFQVRAQTLEQRKLLMLVINKGPGPLHPKVGIEFLHLEVGIESLSL